MLIGEHFTATNYGVWVKKCTKSQIDLATKMSRYDRKNTLQFGSGGWFQKKNITFLKKSCTDGGNPTKKFNF